MAQFTIIDLETTGLRAVSDKITEIAIVKFDGKKVLDTYSSLINPERHISSQITRLTGITNEMVAEAPYFYEIAEDIVKWTEDAVFVAHNVNFDYRFLQTEFRSLGYTFSKKKLCTVRMSKRVFPRLHSYSLGNLIKELGIDVEKRHRALDDALATTELLQRIMRAENANNDILTFINHGVHTSTLPKGISMEMLHNLPEYCGIYYLEDNSGNVVYVGKALNIQKRVFQHFSGSSRKTDALLKSVGSINTLETGSELYALLLEDQEIKRLRPPINRAQKRKCISVTIEFSEGKYNALKIVGKEKSEKTLNSFTSTKTARAYLSKICEDYQLCACHCGLSSVGHNSCINHYTGKCTFGPFHKEEPTDYNQRVAEASEQIRAIFKEDFLLLDNGRTPEEKTVISIRDGYCDRIGYISDMEAYTSVEAIYNQLDFFEGSIASNKIILQYMHQEKHLKKLTYK